MYRALALFAAGCTSSGAAATVHVHVQSQGGVTKVGYRDASDWTWIAANDSGDYGLVVEDDYMFLIVCNDGNDAFEVASTREEPPMVIEYCGAPKWNPSGAVTVSTQVNTQAIITMDRETYIPDASSVTLDVHPGVYDLVATNALYMPVDPHIVIRRDRKIQSATTEPPIDLAGAAPMDVAPITIDGDTSGGLVKTDVALVTKRRRVTLASVDSKTIYVAPSALLLDGEQQEIDFFSSSGQAFRDVHLAYRGEPMTITLPEKITGLVHLVGEEAAWETLPAFTWVQLDTSSTANRAKIRASPGWLAKHGPNHLRFDASEYRTFAPTDASFTIQQVDGDVSFKNGISLLP